MIYVESMTYEQLQEYAAANVDWSKVPECDQVDWENDDVTVIRAKVKKALEFQ